MRDGLARRKGETQLRLVAVVRTDLAAWPGCGQGTVSAEEILALLVDLASGCFWSHRGRRSYHPQSGWWLWWSPQFEKPPIGCDLQLSDFGNKIRATAQRLTRTGWQGLFHSKGRLFRSITSVAGCLSLSRADTNKSWKSRRLALTYSHDLQCQANPQVLEFLMFLQIRFIRVCHWWFFTIELLESAQEHSNVPIAELSEINLQSTIYSWCTH